MSLLRSYPRSHLFLAACLLALLLAFVPRAAVAAPPAPFDPMRQPRPTSSYGMDILGPAWQWNFPRDWNEVWYKGGLRIDQVDEIMRQSWAAGVRADRIAAWWCFIELERDQYFWTDMDIMLQISSNYGIEPVPEIMFTPYWARADATRTKSCINNWKMNYPPDNIADWSDFMNEIARRYGVKGKNQVHYWEIWNEPDLPEFLSIVNDPGGGTVAVYADLLKTASRSIRQNDPGASVLMGGLSDIRGPKFLGSLLDLTGNRDIRQDFDIIPFHAFSAHTIKLELLTLPLKERNLSYELWINEFNNIEWQNDYALADAQLAGLHSLVKQHGVTRTFWFKAWTTKWGPGIFLNRDPLWEVKPFTPSPFFASFKRQALPAQMPGTPTLGRPPASAPTDPLPTFRWARPNAGAYPIAGYKFQVDDTLYKGKPYFTSPEIDAWAPAGEVHFLPLQINQRSRQASDQTDAATAPVVEAAPPNVPLVSYRPTIALKPGLYYWRVAAVDTEGNVGPYAEPRLLVITAGSERNYAPLQRRR